MSEHDRSQLGAYALGALDPDEVRSVDEHLAGCVECRDELAGFEELKEFLGEVPPEAFLDGPPSDGDLLLQRTLREVRAASAVEPLVEVGPAEPKRPRWMVVAAAVVIIAGAALGGGILIGRQSVDQANHYATPDPSVTTPAGSRHGTATDAGTGATMSTTVEPRTGWSWVDVKISDLKAGAECQLLVTDKKGTSYVAGSWVVSVKAAREGSNFGGGVLIPISQVKSVEIQTAQGQHVVTTTV